jgi:hypothetical protein
VIAGETLAAARARVVANFMVVNAVHAADAPMIYALIAQKS